MVVEVISPTHRLTQVRDKTQNWLGHGAPIVVVANPRNRTVEAHTSDGVTELTEADMLGGGDALPGRSMPVADIFSWEQGRD